MAAVSVNVMVSLEGVVVVINWVTTTPVPVVVSAGKTTWVEVKVMVEMAPEVVELATVEVAAGVELLLSVALVVAAGVVEVLF